MIAVAIVGGHQAIVSQGDILEIDKQHAEIGATIELPVMLLSGEKGEGFQIGAPLLEGKMVTAKIIEHGRGDKIHVYKMKPRKRYRRKQGHRQDYTAIEIISLPGAPAKKAAPKKAAEPVAEDTE